MSQPKRPSLSEEPRGLTAGVAFRAMRGADVPAVAALHRDAFAMPWSERVWRHEVRAPSSRVWVAVRPGDSGGEAVVGVVVLWLLPPPEAEIATLVVHPEHRRQGIGRALLRQALTYACAQGPVQRVFLEVRADNAPAQALYRAFGFAVVGRRRHYYFTPQGRVDALIMRRECGLRSPLP